MDLASAKKEAAARSLASKKKVFVNLLENSEHELAPKAGKQVMVVYNNGLEVAAPVAPVKSVKQPAPKTKKAASKVKPKTKKVMKKVSKKSAKKVVNRVAVPKGKPAIMTAKQLRAKVVEGAHVFNSRGREIPCTMMANNEPAKKLNVVVAGSGVKKNYFITRVKE